MPDKNSEQKSQHLLLVDLKKITYSEGHIAEQCIISFSLIPLMCGLNLKAAFAKTIDSAGAHCCLMND